MSPSPGLMKQVRKFRHVGFIAYETGITLGYRLIDSIMPNYDNRTAVSLLWLGQEMDDFVFLEEFSMLAEQFKLNFNVMLHQKQPGWIGPFGPVTETHIRDFMPPPGDDTIILLTGGSKEVAHVLPILKHIGY
ncbi:unnamed protein product [Sphagnum balticum]